jgi:hypothetical protein
MATSKTIQDLQMEIGERAICKAGYPHKSTLVVECIKDFDSAPNQDDIVNNPFTYVKIVDGGKYGALTSHWISSNWKSL